MFSVTPLKEYRCGREPGPAWGPPLFTGRLQSVPLFPAAFPFPVRGKGEIGRLLERVGDALEDLFGLGQNVLLGLPGYYLEFFIHIDRRGSTVRLVAGEHAPDNLKQMACHGHNSLALPGFGRHLLGAMKEPEISFLHRRIVLEAVPGGLDSRPLEIMVASFADSCGPLFLVGAVLSRDKTCICGQLLLRGKSRYGTHFQHYCSRSHDPDAVDRKEVLELLCINDSGGYLGFEGLFLRFQDLKDPLVRGELDHVRFADRKVLWFEFFGAEDLRGRESQAQPVDREMGPVPERRYLPGLEDPEPEQVAQVPFYGVERLDGRQLSDLVQPKNSAAVFQVVFLFRFSLRIEFSRVHHYGVHCFLYSQVVYVLPGVAALHDDGGARGQTFEEPVYDLVVRPETQAIRLVSAIVGLHDENGVLMYVQHVYHIATSNVAGVR